MLQGFLPIPGHDHRAIRTTSFKRGHGQLDISHIVFHQQNRPRITRFLEELKF